MLITLWLWGALAAPPVAPPAATPAAAVDTSQASADTAAVYRNAGPTTPEGVAYANALVAQAQAAGLHEAPEWHALMHYRDEWITGIESEADGPGFYFAPTGATEPEAELAATIRAFLVPAVVGPTAADEIAPPAERHPQCNFPARFAWLNERLGFDPARLPTQPCPNYTLWRKRIGAKGLTLVFADAYLNNPASMYGHTFLRLDKGSPLLSYAVNYSADAWTTNGLLFAVLGMFGGFDGFFSTTPYYLKVQEYNNVESRDLWEYPLTVTPAELDRLVAHAWEMGTTHFDYFFFSENCSYMLLTLLDAMRPSLRLADDFEWWVIPTDTLRSVLRRPGLVGERRWRPAHRSQLIAHRDALSAADRDRAEAVAEGDLAAVDGLAPERQARVLETGHLLMRWREGYTRKEDAGWKAQERALLRARAALKVRLAPLDSAPRMAPPEAGHPTTRAAIGGGISDRGAHTRLQVRFALHDLLDDETGYPAASHLEKFDLRLRWDGSSSRDGATLPYIEQLDLVDILSVTPYERWLFKPSWHARLAVDEAVDLGCAGWDCLTLAGRLGGGLSFGAGPVSPFYVMAATHLRAFGPLQSYGLAGVGGMAGARLTAGPWRVLAEGEAFYDVLGHETGLKWTARLGQSLSLTPGFALRLDTLLGNGDRYEAGLLGLIYF